MQILYIYNMYMNTTEFISGSDSEYLHTVRAEALFNGIAHGYRSVNDNYGPNSKEPLPYHHLRHTDFVTQTSATILNLVRSADASLVDIDDIVFVAQAAAFHDVHQEYTISGSDIERIRVAVSMNSESISCDRMCEYMLGNPLFCAEDIAIARPIVLATVIHFDPKTRSVTQPHVISGMQEVDINRRNSLMVPALAMADLGYPWNHGTR